MPEQIPQLLQGQGNFEITPGLAVGKRLVNRRPFAPRRFWDGQNT